MISIKMNEEQSDLELFQKAIELIEIGNQFAEKKMTHLAKENFKKSVATYPTSEGYTYWAWMLSFEKEYKHAIHLCKKAIELDPEFGNPYNDIGSYLLAQCLQEEAKEWFNKAKKARNYKLKYFPYINLGRIYLQENEIVKARNEYLAALNHDPHNIEARYVLEHLYHLEPGNTYFSITNLSKNSTIPENKQYVSIFSLN